MAETASKERDSVRSAENSPSKSKDQFKTTTEQKESRTADGQQIKSHFSPPVDETGASGDGIQMHDDSDGSADHVDGEDRGIRMGSSKKRTASSTEGLDDDFNDELSPPPDTPQDDSPSNDSDEPVADLADEIVVGTEAQNGKGPLASVDYADDREMEDGEDEHPVSHYPKRKRTSMYRDLGEDTIDTDMTAMERQPLVHRTVSSARGRPATSSMKGVLLGYWRDSPVPNEQDKHGVTGFIDVRDRLRTRIQPKSRFGKLVNDEWPMPPGPGGSWVTFEKVAFDSHLVNLDHFQVKEYVRIRMETFKPMESAEETEELNRKAVQEAIRNVQENPPPETAQVPQIAYGPDIPDHAQTSQRGPAEKRRKLDKDPGTIGTNSAGKTLTVPVTSESLDQIPGTRPTRVLLGYWKSSSEPKEEDRHAVFGILGANDMFRVKVARETRDGRRVEGNFPQGAGALWLHWHDFVPEPHLKTLNRAEVKEYVRIRQRQLDEGESAEHRRRNETEAVAVGCTRAAVVEGRVRVPPAVLDEVILRNSSRTILANGEELGDAYKPRRESAGQELRSSRRELPDARPRHSLPDQRMTRGFENDDAKINSMNDAVDRELARIEASQARRAAAQREAETNAGRETTVSSDSNKHRAAFSQNISRINDVWSRQEEQRQRAGVDDAKYHNGLKYERKQTGPFQGKLVSQGTLISIDGEDYVEYRVLTKPAF